MAASIRRVELGFAEKPDDSSPLTSPFFPNKVGGKPAWLDLQNLPPPEQLICDSCRKPCVFLLQVYAPLDDNPQAFHRSVFLFLCRDSSCHQGQGKKPFKVLRSQLPKVNSFYSSEVSSSSHDGSEEQNDVLKSKTDEPSETLNTPPLCIVCGCLGPKRCGRCQQAHYCSKEHQVHDWKSGHKLICRDLAARDIAPSKHDMQYIPSAGVLLLELEIVTESEPTVSETRVERSEEERMEDYLKFVKSSKYKDIGSSGVKTEKTLETAKSDVTSDKYFRAFKQRVALEPEQVLRYERGGQPLLVSGENVPCPQDIPKCSCGAERIFEFQVMPQLLYYLKQDSVSGGSIDWGTLLVYCCADSCGRDRGYHEEFLWKQDFSQRKSKSVD